MIPIIASNKARHAGHRCNNTIKTELFIVLAYIAVYIKRETVNKLNPVENPVYFVPRKKIPRY